MIFNRKLMDKINEEDFGIPPKELLGLLEERISRDHTKKSPLGIFLTQLKDILYFDLEYSLNSNKLCIEVCTKIRCIFGVLVPNISCDYVDRILQRLDKAKLHITCLKTDIYYTNVATFSTYYTPGVRWTISEGALLLYENIIKEECSTFFDLQAQCLNHSSPC